MLDGSIASNLYYTRKNEVLPIVELRDIRSLKSLFDPSSCIRMCHSDVKSKKECKVIDVLYLSYYRTFPNLLLFLQEICSFWPLGGLSNAHAKASSHSGVAPVEIIYELGHVSLGQQHSMQ
jgi:hypothetical protein